MQRAFQRGLIPLSMVYGHVAAWRRERHTRRARVLDVPVVSVGNVTCGGTGKTPTVEMLARSLLERGRRPALLSRGYGRDPSGGAFVRYLPPWDSAATEPYDPTATAGGNDELQLLAMNLPGVPHLQAPDRHQEGLVAIGHGADVLILDDGFQHARLHRAVDMVLIDALAPFGGGYPLPAGLLREPLEALRFADVLAISRSNQVRTVTLSTLSAYLRARFPGIPQLFLESSPVAWCGLDGVEAAASSLGGRRALAFCGIGNPLSFRRQLEGLGVTVADLVGFRDHHRYTVVDLRLLEARARALAVDEVVMTQKDAVKILSMGKPSWKYLRVEQRIVRGREHYEAALTRLLSDPDSQGPDSRNIVPEGAGS